MVLLRYSASGVRRGAIHRPAGMRYSSSSAGRAPLLLSPEEYKRLPKQSTIPLDCSWHMPNSTRSAAAEYLSGPRLPGAKRWDLDEVAELAGEKNLLNLTHMLPSKERFVEECRTCFPPGKLGIQDDSHVVLYDTIGVFSSPRGAFTFKTLGHEKVSILDGGLPRWIEEGGEVEVGEVPSSAGQESTYTGGADASDQAIRSYEQVVENSQKAPSESTSEVVLDHRPLARYTAEAAEPRPGLSSGHIPNSLPLPFNSYLSPSSDKKPYTSYKSPEELREVLVQGVGGEGEWQKAVAGKGVVFTCGSGMTAAVGWLANEVAKEAGEGAKKTSLYDESWTGYASRPESKITKGREP